MTPDPDAPLIDVLGEAQRVGMLGRGPIPAMIDHASAFVDALPAGELEVVDLGSGGGLPGLVVATHRMDVRLTMVDRRAKRTDFCRRAVSRLGLQDRVSVVTDDIARLVADPTWQSRFDAAICRGLGPPATTARFASALVRVGGLVVISEPPPGSPARWDPAELDAAGLRGTGAANERVAVFVRV